jgi:hypothetical protein
MGRYDEDWPPGRPSDTHRHLCDLCKFGVVIWTSEEECSPVHDDHHEGACAKCRKELGRKEVQRRLAALRAFDAARRARAMESR